MAQKKIGFFKLGDHVEFRDFTETPDILEKMIDDKRLVGVITFYKLTGDKPGKFQLGMQAGGMTIEQTFDLICMIRRSMMDTMHFIDMADATMMEADQDSAKKIAHKPTMWAWRGSQGPDCPPGMEGDHWRAVETERMAHYRAFDTKGEYTALYASPETVRPIAPPEPLHDTEVGRAQAGGDASGRGSDGDDQPARSGAARDYGGGINSGR